MLLYYIVQCFISICLFGPVNNYHDVTDGRGKGRGQGPNEHCVKNVTIMRNKQVRSVCT